MGRIQTGGQGRAGGGFADSSWDLHPVNPVLGSGVGIIWILFFLMFLKVFLRQDFVVVVHRIKPGCSCWEHPR